MRLLLVGGGGVRRSGGQAGVVYALGAAGWIWLVNAVEC